MQVEIGQREGHGGRRPSRCETPVQPSDRGIDPFRSNTGVEATAADQQHDGQQEHGDTGDEERCLTS